MTDDVVERCTVCQLPELEHWGKQHVYAPPGARVDTSQFARKRPNVARPNDDEGATREVPVSYTQTPFDPVLRQALLDAGVITFEQLDEAKKKIEAITGMVTGGSNATRNE